MLLFIISGWLLSSSRQIPQLFQVFPTQAFIFAKPPEIYSQAYMYEGRSKSFEPNLLTEEIDWWAYIYFFNVITAFVNAQLIALSKFLNACELEEFWQLLQPLFSRILELIIGRKSLSTEVLLQIWKQMVITRCQDRRIWWVMHFFKSGFKYSSLSNMWPVGRCIVVQK